MRALRGRIGQQLTIVAASNQVRRLIEVLAETPIRTSRSRPRSLDIGTRLYD
jgi:hypothetical protein